MTKLTVVLAAVVSLEVAAHAEQRDATWFDRQTVWNGYDQFHFQVADRSGYLTAPRRPATGNPWVWRARFPNYHAEMDIALLAKGYHVAYIDVAGLFGSPQAVKIGDEFYEYLTTKRSLSRKPCLEGVSRGGLFVYNWAAKNTDKVACIYCDTPVCDFGSWPGGKGTGLGSPTEWQQCLKAYGLNAEQALQFDRGEEAFSDRTLPFYFVQLPGSGARAGWPYLREQQRLSADLSHTGMVVTIDLLDEDIHPPNKIDVGERLARWALADEYDRDIAYSGPLFARAEIGNGEARVCFSHAESGLMVANKDGLADPMEELETKLSHFELADKAGRWHPADAVITGNTVTVRNERLPNPIAVRYAYAVNPQGCHLYNRDGLPASPFCSHPTLLKYVPQLRSK